MKASGKIILHEIIRPYCERKVSFCNPWESRLWRETFVFSLERKHIHFQFLQLYVKVIKLTRKPNIFDDYVFEKMKRDESFSFILCILQCDRPRHSKHSKGSGKLGYVFILHLLHKYKAAVKRKKVHSFQIVMFWVWRAGNIESSVPSSKVPTKEAKKERKFA